MTRVPAKTVRRAFEIAYALRNRQRVTALPRPFDWSAFKPLARGMVRLGTKPAGLWYACGGEWLKFTAEHIQHRLIEDRYIYELRIDLSRVLRLRTQKAILAFDAEYGRPWEDDTVIDWARVAEQYAGVEICPYQGNLKMRLFWYYTWDVASGCIWDISAIRSVREIAVL
jgi:hypothetical protein